MIPLSVPNFEGHELEYVTDAVGQGWVSTGGAYVDRLEQEMAKYVHAPACVACQSGTAALHMSLIELGVKEGDMVLVPTLTFIAAVNPVAYLKAVPVFMDCDDSLCMDPAKLRDFCERECHMEEETLVHTSTGKRVAAVIVVHVFGNMADMEKIMDVADEYHLKVLEDATEAIGSFYESGRYKGMAAGMIGDLGAYSFNGNKIITTGGGGMIAGRDSEALKHLKYMSTQCKDDPHFYIHHEVGFNYRMTNVQAAIGVAQMEELEEFIRRKNRNFELYRELLSSSSKGYLLSFREGVRSNKWFYSFVMNRDILNRPVREYIHELEKKGIQTRPIWGLIHEQKPYVNEPAYRIETAKYYSERVINIPCSTNITDDEIQKTVEALETL